MPGRPTIWNIVGQGPTALADDAGGDCLDNLLSSIFSFLFLPLFGRRWLVGFFSGLMAL